MYGSHSDGLNVERLMFLIFHGMIIDNLLHLSNITLEFANRVKSRYLMQKATYNWVQIAYNYVGNIPPVMLVKDSHRASYLTEF